MRTMFQELLRQLFSDQCQLTYLHLDITNTFYNIYQCLDSNSHLKSNIISTEYQSYCLTLRHLEIQLGYTYILEYIIEHVPNLEKLSVYVEGSLIDNVNFSSNIQRSRLSNENWFNKIPKLECFKLKSYIENDLEFSYLKWLLNNINHIKKLEIHLYIRKLSKSDQFILKSFIDANFIHQYCLPDQIINLKDFRFYIRVKRQLSLDDIKKIINSFKTNSFFIYHQWTTVKCFYNKKKSYQYLFSSILDQYQLFDGLL
ncbi:unnamed protein product [Rotaria sp. Silwood2]|nr:unnamed protein product [Rotaria sp. Silwood2]CAF3068369.1 unnamed protein product [Rotaria sp. Silwood2]CAF3102882.1 unnamed protein product [Rotaria sp. Silwood2]CAF4199617.1 unnamed protein product [Rotaria sp. Silwood2]